MDATDLLGRIDSAFGTRTLPKNPSILPGQDHTEWYHIESVLAVDWQAPRPADLNRIADAMVLLSGKGFGLVLGHVLRLCVADPRPMLGNGLMLQLVPELTADPAAFQSDPARRRYADLSDQEIAVCQDWADWLYEQGFLSRLPDPVQARDNVKANFAGLAK